MSDTIAELVATFGLSVDEAEWDRGLALLERARKGMSDLHDAQHKNAKHGEEAEGAGKEFAKTIEEGLEAYVGYEGIKTITEMTEQIVSGTLAAKRFGERLGITATAVAQLGYAAAATGVRAETLHAGMQRLAFSLEGNGIRSGFAAKAFGRLHLSLSDLQGQLKHGVPLDQILGQIADHFKAMPDGAEKSALAMQVFGRSAGPALIPMLNKGKAGIKELREEAARLGIEVSEDAVKQAEKYEEAQNKLTAVWGSVKGALVVAILPALELFLGGLTAVVAFLRTHESVMIVVFASIAAAIAYVAVQAAIAWQAILGPFILFEVAAAAVIALVVGIWKAIQSGHPVLAALLITLGLIAVVLTAIFAPVYLIVAGIVALGAATLYVAAHWEKFKRLVGEVADAIRDGLSDALDYLADLPIVKQLLEVVHGIEHLTSHTPEDEAMKVAGDKAAAKAKAEGKDPGKARLDAATAEFNKQMIAEHTEKARRGDAGAAEWLRKNAPQPTVTHIQNTPQANVTHIQNNVTIHANGADAHKVGEIVKRELADTHRHAAAAHKKGG